MVIALGLRYCGQEYSDIMKALKERFGEDALRAAGLLKRSSSKADRLVPSFWHYFAQKAGFLVIPYMKDGRPVYLVSLSSHATADGKSMSPATSISFSRSPFSPHL